MRARMAAMCRLLESEGHMTPIATRQILAVVDAEHPDPIAAANAWQSKRYEQHPRHDDAGTGVENEQESNDE